MKMFALILCLLSSCAFGQNPDTAKYATRQILLVDATPGAEGVLPMIVTTDGKSQLEFVPVHLIKEFLDKGAHPVTLGDFLSLLGAANQKVAQLQAENDRLWKVAMKDIPKPQTVVVQQPATQPIGPSEAEIEAQRQAEANARRQQAIQTWMMMQNRNQNINVNVTNCTRLPALCAGRQ